MSRCGDVVGYEGDWISLYRKSDKVLIASFRCSENICRKMLERKIVFLYNEVIENIEIKVKRGKR